MIAELRCEVRTRSFKILHDEPRRLAEEWGLETTAAGAYSAEADADVKFGRRLGWYLFARVLKPRVIVFWVCAPIKIHNLFLWIRQVFIWAANDCLIVS